MAKKNPTDVKPFAEMSAEELLPIATEQQTKISELEASVKALTEANEQLKNAPDATALQNEILQLKQDAEEAANIIAELTRENRALIETKGNPNPTCTLADGRVAQLNHGATIKGERYTVLDLAKRPDLVLGIVAKGGSAATLINS